MTLRQRVSYCWHIVEKLFTFALFGVGSLLLATVVFPLLFVISGFSRKRLGPKARFAVHISLKFVIWQLVVLHGIDFRVEHRERLKNLKSKLIVANHPSLLDVVILFSLIPNADCIVKGSLGENGIVRGIVNSIYIVNSKTFDEQLEETKKSLDDGNCLIIFPEGTRSTPGKRWFFKKGAARFALNAKKDVVPIYFGGNEIVGLRKHDKLLSYNPTERYHYYLDVLETIPIESYSECSVIKGSALLTKEMQRVLEERRALDPECTKWA